MPFLSFKETKGSTPIAIVRGGPDANRVVYLNPAIKSDKDDSLRTEVEYDDIEHSLKGKSKEYQAKIYELVERGVKCNWSDDFLEDESKSTVKLINKIRNDVTSNIQIKLPPGSTFEVLPTIDPKKRDTVFLFGCANSGKSYFVKHFAQNYNRVWAGKKKIYLISELEEDETLDSANCKIHRINIKSLVADPIDLNSGEFESCLFIFDDYDTLKNTKEEPLYTVVLELINKVLIKGRHQNISCCIISHFGANGNKTRLILTESQLITVYPFGASKHSIEYVLCKHVGLDKKDVKDIKKLGSRWVSISKNYPQYLVSESIVKILNTD